MGVAIVVPIFKIDLNEKELLSIYRTKHVYQNRDIYFVLPNKFKNTKFKFILNKNESIHYVEDFYLSSIKGYNRLLFQIDFYKMFISYSHILICQIDVFVFKDDLDFWVNQNYSNIGAPILDLKYKEIKLKKGNNGGFCLRNIKLCIKTLQNRNFLFCDLSALWESENKISMKIYRIIVNGLIFNYHRKPFLPILNEDIFWSAIAPKMFPFLKIPSLADSVKFAFDANPKYFYQLNDYQLPSAIHAWCKYDIGFVQSLIDNLEN